MKRMYIILTFRFGCVCMCVEIFIMLFFFVVCHSSVIFVSVIAFFVQFISGKIKIDSRAQAHHL